MAIKITIGEAEHTVRQIAVCGYQLVVVAPQKFPPREVGVAGLRHIDREYVAKRIGVVAFQIAGKPDRPVAAGGELPPLQGEELVGGNIVGQVQSPISQENRRPDEGVKRDVILADKIVCPGISGPELAPQLAVSIDPGPFLARREISDHRLKPDVNAFVLESVHRHGDAPFEVTGDRPVPKAFLDISHSKIGDIRSPMSLRPGPRFKPVAEP